MELNEQHEYRDLLSSIPFPSYPSDILWKPIRVSSSGLLFSSTKISLIIAWIPESESCHDSKNCPSHKPMRTHWENDLLYIFAFLKAWTMAYRWNRFWEASRCFWQGRHKYITSNRHSKSEQVGGHGPGAPMVQRWCHPETGPTCGFYVMLLSTLCISCKHQLQYVFFFTNSSSFGFYLLLLVFSFLRRVWMLFKEYGCSRTERIQKWSGVLSNALLRVHYKDE